MKVFGGVCACIFGFLVLQPVWADASTVVIKGDSGIEITEADIREELLLATPDVRENILGRPDYLTQIAMSLYSRRYLAAEALALGLDRNPETEANLKRNRDKILAEAATIRRDGAAPDAAQVEQLARAQYRAEPEKYQVAEKVRAAHVLIAKGKPGAKKTAEDVHAQLLAGESFEKIVEAYSDDAGSKARAGDLGWFERGKMVKPFEEAAFALTKTDEYSGVVETEFGYHVIKLYGKLKSTLKPFDEVKDQIAKTIVAGLARQRRAETSDAVMRSARVNQEAIQQLVTKSVTTP